MFLAAVTVSAICGVAENSFAEYIVHGVSFFYVCVNYMTWIFLLQVFCSGTAKYFVKNAFCLKS